MTQPTPNEHGLPRAHESAALADDENSDPTTILSTAVESTQQ